jgi:hypothetical protein
VPAVSERHVDWMLVGRIAFAAAGIALLLFGLSRLATKVPPGLGVWVGVWLVAALIIHDGLLAPLVIGVGAALRRFVPDRGRRYLQLGLIMMGIVTVIALPLAYRRFTQPPGKAMLLQDYVLNWGVLLGVLGGITLILYAIRVARDRKP